MPRLNKQRRHLARLTTAKKQDVEDKRKKGKSDYSGWFDIPKAEITPEVKRHLQLLKLRDVLDPKRFYKKDNVKELPTHFQVC